jgi:signal transduction histidine kinase
MLDVSKIQSGSLNMRRECFNLKDVITNNLDNTILIENNISGNSKGELMLGYTISQDSFMQGDSDRISQVVHNLVNNAFKFSRDGGNITVSSKVEDNNKVVVSVKDSGQGIDPKKFLLTYFQSLKLMPYPELD